MHLSVTCLDDWIGDFDNFKLDFLKFCYEISKACGYYFDFDQTELQRAHTFWRDECGKWDGGKNISELSHLKIVSCLCVALSKFSWIKQLEEYESQERDSEYSGSAEERLETRRDINGAGEVFFAYQLSIIVLNWFERARDDRLQPFAFRMTPGLEHDIIHYLISENAQIYGMFLTFKALYARDFKLFVSHDGTGD